VAIAFGAATVLSLAGSGNLPQLYTSAFVLVLPYALYRWGSGRNIVIGTAVLLANAGASALPGVGQSSDTVAGAAMVLAAMALGVVFRTRHRARLRELDRVKLMERERLARDLHDTVAHHVSAIAIRAQAGLATAAIRPEAAAEALAVIEQEASRTLAEMRGMVRVLRRGEPADLAPSPGLADLQRLAGQDRDGPPVAVELSGDVGAVPPPVAAAVYRLAQESVTNARRHARHATRIDVQVAADSAAVRLRVSDDGAASPAGAPGFGLLGMKERAELLGGRCEAGPEPGRGWTVTAVLPRAGVTEVAG
jgi:signal transduction histidine kinase